MYYALWIPCLSQVQPQVITPSLRRSLKDVKEFEACRFHSEADPGSCNVTLNYSLSQSDPFRTIVFQCQHRTHTGIIIYQVTLGGATDRVLDSLRGGMHPSIYHLIKSHFHLHSFHAEECDSLLKPYCSGNSINIANQSVMKTIYTFYLEQYRKKLQGAYTDLSAQYAHLRNQAKKNRFISFLTESKRIKADCEEIIGEAAYAKSLLTMSRATVRTQIYEQITTLTLELEQLSRKASDTYTLLNNRYSNRVGRYGLSAGLISIFLTLGLEIRNCSHKDEMAIYREEYLRLKQRADSLNLENRKILDYYNGILPLH